METKKLWKKLIQFSKKNTDYYSILKGSTILEATEYELHIELSAFRTVNLAILFNHDFNNFIKKYWKEQTYNYVKIFFYTKKRIVNFGCSEYTYLVLENFLVQTGFYYSSEAIRIYSDMFSALLSIFDKKIDIRYLIEIYFEYYMQHEENKNIQSFKIIFNELKNDYRLKKLFCSEIPILAYVIYDSIYIQRSHLENPSWIEYNFTNPTSILKKYNDIKNTQPYKMCIGKNVYTINSNLQKILDEFNSLIGLENVKEYLNSFINLVKLRKVRQEKRLPEIPISFHMLFSGNPGTGKTTVARYLAKIYKELGILKKGHLIEVDRSDLVGKFVGESEVKTKTIIEKALDGVLFIDEAYALTSTKSENDYGKEVINLLVKAMEDYRERLVVIVAGYPKLMEEFINSNPGLKSRFSTRIDFQNYLPSELFEIFKKICRDYNIIIDAKTFETIKSIFENMYLKSDKNFGNARAVRNFFDRIQLAQANRLTQNNEDISIDELSLITISDVKKAALDLSLNY